MSAPGPAPSPGPTLRSFLNKIDGNKPRLDQTKASSKEFADVQFGLGELGKDEAKEEVDSDEEIMI